MMDIEKLAREAGGWRNSRGQLCLGVDGIDLTQELRRFAALVAEECAKICDDVLPMTSVEAASEREWLASQIRERFKAS